MGLPVVISSTMWAKEVGYGAGGSDDAATPAGGGGRIEGSAVAKAVAVDEDMMPFVVTGIDADAGGKCDS